MKNLQVDLSIYENTAGTEWMVVYGDDLGELELLFKSKRKAQRAYDKIYKKLMSMKPESVTVHRLDPKTCGF
jgi:hypothetical protein